MGTQAFRYRLPEGTTGLVFGPHSLFGHRLWFVRNDGTKRRATRRQVKEYLAAFPGLARPSFRKRLPGLRQRGSGRSIHFAPSL